MKKIDKNWHKTAKNKVTKKQNGKITKNQNNGLE